MLDFGLGLNAGGLPYIQARLRAHIGVDPFRRVRGGANNSLENNKLHKLLAEAIGRCVLRRRQGPRRRHADQLAPWLWEHARIGMPYECK